MIFAQGQPDFRLSVVAKFVLLLVRVSCAARRTASGSRSLGVGCAARRTASGSGSLGVGCAACRAASGSGLVSRVSSSAGSAGKCSYIL